MLIYSPIGLRNGMINLRTLILYARRNSEDIRLTVPCAPTCAYINCVCGYEKIKRQSGWALMFLLFSEPL